SDGEQSRTPIPWERIDEFAPTISLYRRLIALRRGHPALAEGGIRWLHVSDEAVAFVREHAAECVLVLATRALTTVDLDGELPDDAELLFAENGELPLPWSGGRVSTAGPTFVAWRLPGVALP